MSGHSSHPPSTKSIYIILVSTFFFGFLAGVVFFLQNNVGGEDGALTKKDTRGFEILAYTYGGCARVGCASYRVIQDGSYIFFGRGRENEDMRFKGDLPDYALDELTTILKDTNFSEIKDTKFVGQCPSEFDGIGFRYDITYKGEMFTVDSCKEDLSKSTFFKLLLRYFNQFADNESKSHE